MKPIVCRLKVTTSLERELADQIAEQIRNAPTQVRADVGAEPARVEIQRQTVMAQSLSEWSTLIVAIGGGAGVGAIGTGLAKAIKLFSDRHPTGKVTYEKDGLSVELANLPAEKLDALFDIIVRQQEFETAGEDQIDNGSPNLNAAQIVIALGGPRDKIIDGLYDPICGTYYGPPVMGDPLPPTDLPETREQVIAIIDTGIMTHHPWIRGNIDDHADFTGEGIEDRSGHGTAVALIALSALKGSSPDAKPPRLLIAKALDQDGCGSEQWLVAALKWVAAKRADIVQLSLGIYRDGGCQPDCEICGLVEKISIDGAWVTVAAGNDPNRYTCPQDRHFATQKVGVTDPSGTRVAEYSGPGASIVAKLPPGFVPIEI